MGTYLFYSSLHRCRTSAVSRVQTTSFKKNYNIMKINYGLPLFNPPCFGPQINSNHGKTIHQEKSFELIFKSWRIIFISNPYGTSLPHSLGIFCIVWVEPGYLFHSKITNHYWYGKKWSPHTNGFKNNRAFYLVPVIMGTLPGYIIFHEAIFTHAIIFLIPASLSTTGCQSISDFALVIGDWDRWLGSGHATLLITID